MSPKLENFSLIQIYTAGRDPCARKAKPKTVHHNQGFSPTS